jgi:hypothetical protein
LEVETLVRHADGDPSDPGQESSQVRSAWSALSYEGTPGGVFSPWA